MQPRAILGGQENLRRKEPAAKKIGFFYNTYTELHWFPVGKCTRVLIVQLLNTLSISVKLEAQQCDKKHGENKASGGLFIHAHKLKLCCQYAVEVGHRDGRLLGPQLISLIKVEKSC